MPDAHDWTNDPRPLSECLKEFNRRVNGGQDYGSRKAGQEALSIRSTKTFSALLDGHKTPWEPVVRLAMAEAERRYDKTRLDQ